MTLARSVFGSREEEGLLSVHQWAEVRRLVLVEGLSERAVARRLGLARATVARAVASETPPRYVRAPAGSKLDRFKEWVCEQLREDPRIEAQRLRELAGELGYGGGKTIFDDYVREVRPRFLVRRTFQRTVYRPGELVQCDLWEVGAGSLSWLDRRVAGEAGVGPGVGDRGWWPPD